MLVMESRQATWSGPNIKTRKETTKYAKIEDNRFIVFLTIPELDVS